MNESIIGWRELALEDERNLAKRETERKERTKICVHVRRSKRIPTHVPEKIAIKAV